MTRDDIDILQCKFCAGALRLNTARKPTLPGFRYFRCVECDMPNVFGRPVLPVRTAAPGAAGK